jgi:hypothetical protein
MSQGILILLFIAIVGPSVVSWLVSEFEFWRQLKARNLRFAEHEIIRQASS